jgi:hypothetical protein
VSGGQRVDADQLKRAARALSEAPKQAAEQPLRTVAQTQIAAADFGVAHGERLSAYSAGVRKLVACAGSYLTASDDFAKRLNDAAARYSGNERRAADEVRRH